MTPMNVLVTGGAGFIGSHVVDALLAQGHRVRVLDALLAQAWADSVPDLPPDVEFVHGDVRDHDTVRRCLDGVDVVSHHAAMVGLGVDLGDLPDYVSHNELGTAVLLAAMAERGLRRLVLASSMVVYGEGGWRCATHGAVRPGPRLVADLDRGNFDPRCPSCGGSLEWVPVEESAALDPRSVYAATKVGQEHLVAAWQRATGGTATALRYHNVYGPRMPRNTPYSGVAAIFRSAIERGERPHVFEDGGQMRDFVHVGDVARANVLALSRQSDDLVAFNVCSGRPHSIGELATAMTEAASSPPPLVTGEYRLGDVRHVVASPVRAASELGYVAAVDLDEGAAQFVRAPLR
jgi:dTDP-L-rhamnose 4-epimerase